MPTFDCYIGIDYSGAQTADSSLKTLRVYIAHGKCDPLEVNPTDSGKAYWTRKSIAFWLRGKLNEPYKTLVGIDHGFSFPLNYFEKYKIKRNWDYFLNDFVNHWPSHKDNTSLELIINGYTGSGCMRTGNSRWRRLTEQASKGAKSVFHFNVPGSVAKSTHAGLPWLRFIRNEYKTAVHFWPFDGWNPKTAKSVLAEVYPSLWSKFYDQSDRTADQHDAYSVVKAFQKADFENELLNWFNPKLPLKARKIAKIEGWILGITDTSKLSDL